MAKSHRGEVKLHPYRDQWHKAFLKERAVIEKELGGRVFEIEHIGSTAVPEMSSRLIIDILVGVDRLEELDEVEGVLADMGYARSSQSHGPRHRFYVHEDQQGYHLHFLETRILRDTSYVRFRDALIADPRLAKEYKEHKIRLVGNFKCDAAWYEVEKARWIKAWLQRPRA
ncbi:MAG TPA: GrpB family protein [Fibrobacteria bacterium]|nr:GrpB family protein [Fibrobacteria bacterium]